MIKLIRRIKKSLSVFLIFILCINNFAAIVSDNDGSAFITKAEFDSLKNSFQAQINEYQTSIDNKIDGAIAAYLSGIALSTQTRNQLLLWGGKTIGLVEDHRSHPYVEGRVGGKIKLIAYVPNSNSYYNGTSYNSTTSKYNNDANATPTAQRSYFCFCYHEIENEQNKSNPFKYTIADYGTLNGKTMWDLKGYTSAKETVTITNYFTGLKDYTNSGIYSIGLCSGWTPDFGTPGTKIEDRKDIICTLCESQQDAVKSTSYDRGRDGNSMHNTLDVMSADAVFKSEHSIDDSVKFLTNVPKKSTYSDIWPTEWYGVNDSNGHDTHASNYDLYAAGWRMEESSSNKRKNFHVKTTQDMAAFYQCDNKAYLRKWMTGNPTNAQIASGNFKFDETRPHCTWDFEKNKGLKPLFKSSTGDYCASDNLYSSEIGSVLDNLESPLVSTAVINKQNTKVAPLYVGLPLAKVTKSNQVKIGISFLDNAKYEVAFMVGGFPNGTIQDTTASQAGCTIAGQKGHTKSIDGKTGGKTETITVNVEKSGILFFKFAVTGNEMGRIKLPSDLIIINEA